MSTNVLDSPPRFEWIEIDGFRLRLRRARRAGAPVLLLTNAWPQTIRCWDRQWDRLAADFELVAVDLPGFGLSQGSRAVMRPSAQADLLNRLLHELQVAAPIMIAPDVGVPIALALASRHPGSVRGLVLFDGPTDFPADVSFIGRVLYRSSVARAVCSLLGPSFVLETIRTGYTDKRARPSRAATMEYLRAAASPRRFGTTVHYLASYEKELPRSGGWPGVDVPVLITWGADDPFLYPSNGERLALTLPDAEFAPMAGVSHYSHEDAGEQFFTVLDDWLARKFGQVGAATIAAAA